MKIIWRIIVTIILLLTLLYLAKQVGSDVAGIILFYTVALVVYLSKTSR